MSKFPALRSAPTPQPWKKGDVLVLFGELFTRGYANGLVDEAERLGMTIVRATVGRRDKDGHLRALNDEETAAIPKPFINVPLEAGFDLEPAANGKKPVDFLEGVKLSDWESVRIDFDSLEDSRRRAEARLKTNIAEFMRQLKPHLPAGANVLFAHLMAGGVPRTKLVMPLINRVVKGTGERALPSEKMWASPIGRFCEMNFLEVTAETFRHLVEGSADVRRDVEAKGGRVSYTAYGYHGTEILIGGEYRWQTYTPYVQGWAKRRLEDVSKEFHGRGLRTCVYNCPEILTNSSSIFQGVELSLYPLLEAFRRDAPAAPLTARLVDECAARLKGGPATLETVAAITTRYYANPDVQDRCRFEQWPQHSTPKQLETMLQASEDLFALHKDTKSLMTAVLSEVVFEACGKLMVHDSWNPSSPVEWIGHDVVVRTTAGS